MEIFIITKIDELLQVRANKDKKQTYHNVGLKKSF